MEVTREGGGKKGLGTIKKERIEEGGQREGEVVGRPDGSREENPSSPSFSPLLLFPRQIKMGGWGGGVWQPSAVGGSWKVEKVGRKGLSCVCVD